MPQVFRHLVPALVALAASSVAAGAQGLPQPGAAPAATPAPPPSVCTRLEAQLSAVERGVTDPARAEQIKRLEDQIARQQADLERVVAQSRRQGCEGIGFFQLFGGQSAQCGPLTNQIQQMRGGIERMQSDLSRLQSAGGPERDAQRRSILVALAQSNCGEQYRAAAQAAQPRGFLETLFGGNSAFPPTDTSQGTTYRTLCVRTCDGFYFPISFSTSQARFRDDEQTCQRSCPGTEVALFSHRNPGEDMQHATSLGGTLYTQLPNAFKFRTSYDKTCSCRRPGESWADALKHLDDRTIERGDIVVTAERAKALSQPKFDASGKPIKPDPRAKPDPKAAAAPPPETPPAVEEKSEPETPKRAVRSVGPVFLPAR
jgi:hypothetical protein